MVGDAVFRQSKYHGLINQTKKKLKHLSNIFHIWNYNNSGNFGDVSVEGMKGN
jgi:hypothetical protein